MAKDVGSWYMAEVFRWRTGASVVWSAVLMYPTLIAFLFVSRLSLFHPLQWIWSCFLTLLTFRMWLCAFSLAVSTALIAMWNAKYTVVPHIFRNRFLLYYNSPFIGLWKSTYALSGSFVVWCLLNVLGEQYSNLSYVDNETRYLNERHVFLVLYGACVGYMYGRQHHVENYNYLTFPAIQEAKLFRVKLNISKLLAQALKAACWLVKYYYIGYYIFGTILTAWFVNNLNLQRRDRLDSIYGLFDLSLLWVSISTGTVVYFSLLLSNLIFKVYNTESFEFPIEATFEEESTRTLQKALACNTEPLVQYLGYHDLCSLSQISRARRKILFSLSQPGGHPHHWTAVSNQCLTDINTLMVDVINFNSQAVANIPLRQASGEKVAYLLKRNGAHTASDNASIFSNQSLSSTFSPASSYSFNATVTNRMHPVTLTSSNGQTTENGNSKGIGQSSVMERMLEYAKKRPVVEYFLGDLADSKSRELFAGCQIQIWAVDALSHLIQASYTEDIFGVVQKTLPDILGCLLSLNDVLERHFKLSSSISRQTKNGDKALRFALRSTTKSALYRIANTFSQHIKSISLTSDHSRKLRKFLDCKE